MGYKLIETRSFKTTVRGQVLIHAATSRYLGKGKHRTSARLISYSPFYKERIGGGPGYDKLPQGAIIGAATIEDVIETEDVKDGMIITRGDKRWHVTAEELAFGDYTPGRYGWLLSNPIKFEKPIPAKGNLSLWDFDLPELYLPLLRA